MKIDYEKAHSLYQEGRLAMDKRDFTKAIKSFELSSQLSPHFKTLELLGECLLNINKPNEAILALAASIGLGSKPFRARYLLGRALIQIDEKSDAAYQLNEAITLKPDYKTARDLLKTLAK